MLRDKETCEIVITRQVLSEKQGANHETFFCNVSALWRKIGHQSEFKDGDM